MTVARDDSAQTRGHRPTKDDATRARELLSAENLSCAAVHGASILTSSNPGVSPLLSWIDEGQDLGGFSVADRVVGKAAAMLYVLLGVHDVYAPVMSADALRVLSSHGIAASYDKLTPAIMNREGSAQCPLDASAVGIEDPGEALLAIRDTVATLAGAAQNA